MTQDDSRAGSLGGLRVMVIDDSKTIRRTAETLLTREGAEVTTATDGFEALAKTAEQKPQIIFIELMMPRTVCYQTCTLITNNKMVKQQTEPIRPTKAGRFEKE